MSDAIVLPPVIAASAVVTFYFVSCLDPMVGSPAMGTQARPAKPAAGDPPRTRSPPPADLGRPRTPALPRAWYKRGRADPSVSSSFYGSGIGRFRCS